MPQNKRNGIVPEQNLRHELEQREYAEVKRERRQKDMPLAFGMAFAVMAGHAQAGGGVCFHTASKILKK